MNCTQYTLTELSELRLNLKPGGIYKLYLVVDASSTPPARSFVKDLKAGASSTKLTEGLYEVCDESNDCGEILFSEIVLIDDGSGGPNGSPESDPKIVCDLNDPANKIFVHAHYDETGNFVEWRNSTNAPVVEGVDFVICADGEDVEFVTDSLLRCNADGQWKVTLVFDPTDTAEPKQPIASLFINPQGQSVADPGDLVPCADVQATDICFTATQPGPVVQTPASYVSTADFNNHFELIVNPLTLEILAPPVMVANSGSGFWQVHGNAFDSANNTNYMIQHSGSSSTAKLFVSVAGAVATEVGDLQTSALLPTALGAAALGWDSNVSKPFTVSGGSIHYLDVATAIYEAPISASGFAGISPFDLTTDEFGGYWMGVGSNAVMWSPDINTAPTVLKPAGGSPGGICLLDGQLIVGGFLQQVEVYDIDYSGATPVLTLVSTNALAYTDPNGYLTPTATTTDNAHGPAGVTVAPVLADFITIDMTSNAFIADVSADVEARFVGRFDDCSDQPSCLYEITDAGPVPIDVALFATLTNVKHCSDASATQDILNALLLEQQASNSSHTTLLTEIRDEQLRSNPIVEQELLDLSADVVDGFNSVEAEQVTTNSLLQALIDKASISVVTQDAVCVNVDGVATKITPHIVYTDGVVTSITYTDELGNPVTGTITNDADPCDCGCC